MKKVLSFLSAGVLLVSIGCSGNSRNTVSKATTLPVVQASPAPANGSSTAAPVAPLPVPPGLSNHLRWRSETVKDAFGSSIVLKQTSADGKFDLVILEKGSHSFVSFVRHSQWPSVHGRAATGKLVNLRVRFEDGEEKHIEWDELGASTNKLYSVVWSYPASADNPVGPVASSPADATVGGDDVLLQDMLKHTTMLLEIEPSVTTQFDLSSLAHALESSRSPKTVASRHAAG